MFSKARSEVVDALIRKGLESSALAAFSFILRWSRTAVVSQQSIYSQDLLGGEGSAVYTFALWWRENKNKGNCLALDTTVIPSPHDNGVINFELPLKTFFFKYKGTPFVGIGSINTSPWGSGERTPITYKFYYPKVPSSMAKDGDEFIRQLYNGGDQNLFTVIAVTDRMFVEPTKTQKRSLSTVYMNKQLKTHIVNSVRKFWESEKEYVENGIPWRYVIVLRGYPGCGKTSFIRALCTEFGVDMISIPPNLIGKGTDSECVHRRDGKWVVAMEDFPMSLVTKRDEINEDDKKEHEIRLSNILNLIDGVSIPYGKVFIITTNDDISTADDAFLRDERINEVHVIPPLVFEDIVDVMQNKFPDFHDYGQIRADIEITGAGLQKALREANGNVSLFLTEINKDRASVVSRNEQLLSNAAE